MKHPLPCTALLLLSLLAGACHDDEAEKAEEAQRAYIEQTRTLLSNSCKQDSDCFVTGCQNTLCRAMPEDDYCDHRIVITLDDKSDLGAIQKLISQRLTVRESESVRLGGYAAGKWTISFHASQAQRERIEQLLETLSMSGFAILHPDADKDTMALRRELQTDPDIALRSMRGAPPLLEKQIRSGDLLSKDDIRNTWQLISPTLSTVIPANDIERLWAYDVVVDKISFLRLWPVDRRQHISIRKWSEMKYRNENGDLHIEGLLMPSATETLENWTLDQRLILLMLGNEVLATALPDEPIDDGKFDFVIQSAAKNPDLAEALVALQAVSRMKGSVRIDRDSTARVERDISCQQKFPRDCGCIAGLCAWKSNPDYNACLYEP